MYNGIQVMYFDSDDFWFHHDELFRQYPVSPNHTRLELEICEPSENLNEVFIYNKDINNHHHKMGNRHLSVYDCFYDSFNWSVIFDHAYITNGDVKLFIEEGHEHPKGERVRLMSTSSDILDNLSYRYLYFRDRYWLISSLHKWSETYKPKEI